MKKITLLAATLFAAVSFGQELITNGDFASDFTSNNDETADWVTESNGNATKRWNVVDGAAKSNGSSSADRDLYQTVTLEASTNYTFSYDYETVGGKLTVNVYAGAYSAAPGSGDVAGAIINMDENADTNGTRSLTFDSVDAGAYTVHFVKPGSGTDTAIVDNVSLQATATLSATKYDANGNLLPIVATYNLLGQKVDAETVTTGIYINVYSNGYSEKFSK